MAVELTDEEKAKFDALLKEKGYDEHASKVIERVNAEAKAQREAREKAEREAKELRDVEAARKAEADRKAAEEEAKRKKEEDDKKSVEDRIKSLEETFKRELTTREEAAVKKQQEFLDELKARDAQVLMLAVEAEAKERGILDAELVKLLDVSKVPIERGRPDREAIKSLIDDHAKSKPHLYKEPDERVRDEGGRFTRPNPTNRKDDVDASQLDDRKFAELEARLRQGKA